MALVLFAAAALIPLFYLLGLAADVLVSRTRMLGLAAGIRVGLLGILLGLFTSAPELMIGLASLSEGIPSVSVGNLLGGIVMLFGVVLGLNAIWQRRIRVGTSGAAIALPALAFLAPLPLGFDGTLSNFDGMLLIGVYLAAFAWINRHVVDGMHFQLPSIVSSRRRANDLLAILASITAILLLSDGIVSLVHWLLHRIPVPEYLVGLIVISVGTNLPEMIVAFQSGRKHMGELSFMHLFSSALANIGLLGAFALFSPLPFPQGTAYLLLIPVLLALAALLPVFARTEGMITRREGGILLLLAVLFFACSAFVT